MLSETSGAVVDMCTDEFSIDIKEPSPEDAIVVASLTLRKKKMQKWREEKRTAAKPPKREHSPGHPHAHSILTNKKPDGL